MHYCCCCCCWETEYGYKLPNTTNSIDAYNVSCDAIQLRTHWLTDDQNSNTITVFPKDNPTRSSPLLYGQRFLPYSPVLSSTISQIRFYLTGSIGRSIKFNGIDWLVPGQLYEIHAVQLMWLNSICDSWGIRNNMTPKRVNMQENIFTTTKFGSRSNQSDVKYLVNRPGRLPPKRPPKQSPK